MKIFYTDLDNTMIFSYKQDIGAHTRMVERYQGREISFITERTYELLQKVKEKMMIVPTTTRTDEQYGRIDLGIGAFPYALTCNGGVLLVNGVEDQEWYETSLHLVSESRDEMKKGIAWLEQENTRMMEVRWIKELFVFTKCEQPELVVDCLQKVLDTELVDVFHNGVKVYIVPKNLNKGAAVRRFQQMIGGTRMLAAGDSEFDVSMLETADLAMAPVSLRERQTLSEKVVVLPQKKVFSEEVLTYILEQE